MHLKAPWLLRQQQQLLLLLMIMIMVAVLLTAHTGQALELNEQDQTADVQYPRQYHIWTSEEIHAQMLDWKEQYPDLVQVWNSQEKYGLKRSGNTADCPFDKGGDGCLHYGMTIQDFVAHPEGSDSSKRLAEVFWSGALHGNERVGPTSVMEAVTLLLEAATCEAKPMKDGAHNVQAEIAEAKACRKTMDSHGISERQRQWLARLVTTRRLVVVPTANALGYYRSDRTEHGIDPNRDFPYDVRNAGDCMKTIAGRTLNEVFREHMFQLSLTFHGGTEVVAYEWGESLIQTDNGSPHCQTGSGSFPIKAGYDVVLTERMFVPHKSFCWFSLS